MEHLKYSYHTNTDEEGKMALSKREGKLSVPYKQEKKNKLPLENIKRKQEIGIDLGKQNKRKNAKLGEQIANKTAKKCRKE